MKKYFLILLSFALLASCSKEQTASQETESACYIPGEVIVQLSEDMTERIDADGLSATKASCFNTAFDALGVTAFERLYPDAGEWEPRHRAAGLHRWYRVTYDSAMETVTKAESGLKAIDGIVFVEPVRKIRTAAVFNDPRLQDQWNYYNDGSKGSDYTSGADINIIPVWQNYTTGSDNVIVAVIDEGVDLQHEDLASNCIPAGSSGSKCFLYDYGGMTIYPGDHGTHVAGTVAAINNNDKGVCGIAGGDDKHPGARIMSCQILRTNPTTGGTDQGDSYNALVWAADNGALIAQNSWGYHFDTPEDAAKGGIGAFKTAVDYFNKYAGCDKDGVQLPGSPMKGGIVIFAAGNDGWAHAWPAEYDGILSVGAMNSIMGRSYYSNYGDWVDICAPGGDAGVGPSILSCIADNKYGYIQGTSMACPHVSGVAALILSHFGGAGFTREMLWDRLVGGANAGTALSKQQIGPLLDALGSFTYGSTKAPDKVSDFSLSVKSNELTLGWKVTADKDDTKAYAYLLLLSKNRSDLVSADPKHIPSTVKSMTVHTGAAAVGDDISAVFKGLDFDTDYWCSIFAYDYSQNYSESSPLKSVRTGKNNPPVISPEVPGPYKVKSFETVSIKFNVYDPDGHSFKVSYEPGSDADMMRAITQNEYTFIVVGKKAPAGEYYASFEAVDQYGASVGTTISYEILENHPPKVIREIDNILLSQVGQTVTLDPANYFYDEDGEALQYSVNLSAPNVANFVVSSDAFRVTALGYGVVEITITATDAAGKSCSSTFKLAVRDSSVPVSLYPNPVSTVLNISTAEEMSAEIRIVNKAGATVRELSHTVSPFDPLALDMTDCPGGVYSVIFKGGPIDGRYTVVKK